MADLFNNNDLGGYGARPRHGKRSPQQEGQQAGIQAALDPGATQTPTLPDLNNASAGVTPPSLRNGGFVAQGAENPALPSVGGPVTGSGTLAQPISLGNYANNLEGFNMNRFNDPSQADNNTWKYRVGSVLSQYAPDSAGLGQAAEFLRGQGVDVQQKGSNGDILSFGSNVVDDQGNLIGDIDVGRGFGAGGSGWAWQPISQGMGQVSGAGGQGGGDINSAFAFLQQNIAPNASKEQMESAITQAFQGVPGFQGAYKESVNIGGQWYDLVGGYGGANPSWQLMPKTDHGGGGGFSPALGGGGLSTLNVPGLQDGGPTYAQKVMEMLLADLGI
jgi:hypothetical protein